MTEKTLTERVSELESKISKAKVEYGIAENNLKQAKATLTEQGIKPEDAEAELAKLEEQNRADYQEINDKLSELEKV